MSAMSWPRIDTQNTKAGKVTRVTLAYNLDFKARLELWQNTVGVGFQRNDHHVSMMAKMARL